MMVIVVLHVSLYREAADSPVKPQAPDNIRIPVACCRFGPLSIFAPIYFRQRAKMIGWRA